MFRVESNVVLRYFEPVDAFVKIRIYTPEEIARLLTTNRISDRRSYIGLILNACLLHYHDQILPPILQLDALADRFAFEDRLYSLCIEVNPSLDIRRIAIPAVGEETSEIHLLEQPKLLDGRRNLERLRDMEARLAQRIIGQEEAIAGVSRAIKKSMAGLRDPSRPIATFLFVGKTGVGKTELAKALTFFLYDDPMRMLRIDCSEYALPHEYAKLIGAPPGYVGHDQPGLLAEAARLQGEAVVLFDEIEKSDPKVHDLLLQIMDEGFVTDNKGRRISFDNALLILTSNVGADELEAYRNRMGFDAARRRAPDRRTIFDETFRSLKDRFRPEFMNRLSDVVLFNSIGLPECERIVVLFLDEVKRHAASVPLTLQFSAEVPHLLAEMGYAPDFGARELRRTVEREIEGPLSDLLVDGHLKQGDGVSVRVRRSKFTFHRN